MSTKTRRLHRARAWHEINLHRICWKLEHGKKLSPAEAKYVTDRIGVLAKVARHAIERASEAFVVMAQALTDAWPHISAEIENQRAMHAEQES